MFTRKNPHRKRFNSLLIALLSMMLALSACQTALPSAGEPTPTTSVDYPEGSREIYLAGGCFWGVEAYMASIDGVIDAVSGYANGKTFYPSYEDVTSGGSGHAETVQVIYDPDQITLEELLIYFFRIIDPTSLNKQGNDTGVQYRTGIYYQDDNELEMIETRISDLQKEYSDPIVVEVEPLNNFFDAESYHQDYLDKNPAGYCHIELSLVNDPVIRMRDYPRPSDEDIHSSLTAGQYHVTQEDGTEAPFDNLYNSHYEPGIYVDIVTGEPLFSSRDKFHSTTGWPSFSKPIVSYVIRTFTDTSLGVSRVEVRSRSGDSHLGHVFEDGPIEYGGLRYCINSAALMFIPQNDMANEGYGDLLRWVE